MLIVLVSDGEYHINSHFILFLLSSYFSVSVNIYQLKNNKYICIYIQIYEYLSFCIPTFI